MLFSYLTYTDKRFDLFFLLLTVILSEFCENPRGKDCITEKSTETNLCEKHHFFVCTPSFLCPFLSFLCLLPVSLGP